MRICNNCGAKHRQPNIDYCTTVPTKVLKERGEIQVYECRVCGSRDLYDGPSFLDPVKL